MNIADVVQSLELVKQSLADGIQVDRIAKSANEVSWFGYRAGIFKNQYYPIEYQWLIDNGQYSFLLKDGSFLQFYYCFDGQGLKSGCVALYPRPIPSKVTEEEIYLTTEAALDMEDDSLSEHLMNIVEEIEQNDMIPANTSHIRFDFDRKVKTHEVSHIQFGGFNEARLPADFFPVPYAFVELISNVFTGFTFSVKSGARSHASNKALRNLSYDSLVGLIHKAM